MALKLRPDLQKHFDDSVITVTTISSDKMLPKCRRDIMAQIKHLNVCICLVSVYMLCLGVLSVCVTL